MCSHPYNQITLIDFFPPELSEGQPEGEKIPMCECGEILTQEEYEESVRQYELLST